MELKLIDSFNSVLKSFSNNLTEDASMFSKNMFLLLLNEFAEFNKSFEFALSNYSNNDNSDIAKTIGFSSSNEFNEVMFLRELNSTINTFTELSDILRNYAKNPTVEMCIRDSGYVAFSRYFSSITSFKMYLRTSSSFSFISVKS